MSKKTEKLKALFDAEGIGGKTEFLRLYAMEGSVPAICMNQECDHTDLMEPDQDQGWCEECQTNSLCSGLILAGAL